MKFQPRVHKDKAVGKAAQEQSIGVDQMRHHVYNPVIGHVKHD